MKIIKSLQNWPQPLLLKAGMLSLLLTMGTILPYTTNAQKPKTENTEAPKKCFPAGASLESAHLFGSTYLEIESVNEVKRMYNLETGKLVAKWPSKNAEGRPNISKSEPAAKYKLLKSSDVEVIVGNVAGKEIYRCEESPKKQMAKFDPIAGTLRMVEKENMVIVHYPDREPVKVKAKNADSEFGYAGRISPDGNWGLSRDGNIFDLKNGKVRKKCFPHNNKLYEVVFNAEVTAFTVPLDTIGTITYSLSTGKVIARQELAKDLPIIDGFEIILLPNCQDYIYWMRFTGRGAKSVAGLAYYVKDGVSLSLCDPEWAVERDKNALEYYTDLLTKLATRLAAEKKHEAEQKEINAKRNDYLLSHPAEREVERRTEWQDERCEYCKGEGKIYYEKLAVGGGLSSGGSTTSYSIDQYGRKTYSTSSGTGSVKCTACKGKGTVRVEVYR